jgi:hypothetical protein
LVGCKNASECQYPAGPPSIQPKPTPLCLRRVSMTTIHFHACYPQSLRLAAIGLPAYEHAHLRRCMSGKLCAWAFPWWTPRLFPRNGANLESCRVQACGGSNCRSHWAPSLHLCGADGNPGIHEADGPVSIFEYNTQHQFSNNGSLVYLARLHHHPSAAISHALCCYHLSSVWRGDGCRSCPHHPRLPRILPINRRHSTRSLSPTRLP